MGRKEEAFTYLKNAILSNKLPPETPVREMDIAKELQMSRTPVREAMRELEADGLIISYPARGTIVAPITPYDVEEIYELRVLHELWALERGFFRITDEELDSLQHAFDEAYRDQSWEKNHDADRRLHRLIVEKSGSKRLVAFVNTLNMQIERIRVSSAKDVSRQALSYKEHSEIIAHIKKKDLPRCKEALHSHLRAVANSAVETTRAINTYN